MPGMPRSSPSVVGRDGGDAVDRGIVQHDIGRHAALCARPRSARPAARRAGPDRRLSPAPADAGARSPRRDLVSDGAIARAGSRLAQHHLGLALQHAARAVRQLQCAKGLAVGAKMAHRHQLAEHGAPLLFIELAADAEHRELVMPELRDALGQAADQHIDQVHGAETLPGAIGAGQAAFARRPCRRGRAAATGSCRNCRNLGDASVSPK